MKKYKSTRLLCLLLAVVLCMSPASAVNIVHEEDYEVLPDYGQMDTEMAITTFLRRELKLNSAAIHGILANMEYESDFSPTVWGDGGTSYGLCQWHESRCRSLFSFCRENDYDVDSVYGQMKYLRYELEENYPAVLEYLRLVEDIPNGAYQAAWYWCYYFEIPAQRDVQANLRGECAYQQYSIEQG